MTSTKLQQQQQQLLQPSAAVTSALISQQQQQPHALKKRISSSGSGLVGPQAHPSIPAINTQHVLLATGDANPLVRIKTLLDVVNIASHGIP